MSRIALVAAILVAAVPTVHAEAATFLFIRHAESTSNAGTATTVQEALDPPLTDKGKQQAQDLAQTLAGQKITFIYTSAYQRTKLTIAPTATRMGLAPITDARTNEWYFGNTKTLADQNMANIVGVIQSWAAGNTAAKAPFPMAESLDDMVARVVPAWTEIVNAHKHEDGVVILVGHGAEIGFVMPYFANNVTPTFAFANGLHNTGIIRVEIVDDKPVVTDWQGVKLPASAKTLEHAH